MSLTYSSTAAAQTCGGAAPCACGDTVTSNKNLSAADPIVRGKCSANGLEVAAGVTLDLKGNLIQGLENGIGIVINGDGVTIKNGKVETGPRNQRRHQRVEDRERAAVLSRGRWDIPARQ